jgi:hypothetical protein
VLGASRLNTRFWEATLTNVARRFGVSEPIVDTEVVCVDRRRQWRYVRNVRYNVGFRSALHGLGAPLRMIRRRR